MSLDKAKFKREPWDSKFWLAGDREAGSCCFSSVSSVPSVREGNVFPDTNQEHQELRSFTLGFCRVLAVALTFAAALPPRCCCYGDLPRGRSASISPMDSEARLALSGRRHGLQKLPSKEISDRKSVLLFAPRNKKKRKVE